jgi:hypothetical protein
MPPWTNKKNAGNDTPPAESAAPAPTNENTAVAPDAAAASDAPDASPPGSEHSQQDKPTGKSAGKQPGSKGFGRKQKLAVSETKHHHPDACAACSQPLSQELARRYSGWYRVDIAELPLGTVGLGLKVIHNLLYETPCDCGHITRAGHYVAEPDALWENVELGQWRLIGPKLAGVIVFLALRMRLSRAAIREFFAQLLDLQLSVGVIDETIREAGRAMAPLEQELATQVEQAVLLHADETPWKEKGQSLWLWAFVAEYTFLFYIGQRTLEMLTNTLGGAFNGTLMSDGYQAYRHLPDRLRCWAHLLRKLQGLTESTDRAVSRTGKAMQELFCTLMEAIYAERAKPKPEQQGLASRYAPQIAKLRSLCESNREHYNGNLRALAREFLLDWDTIFRQVNEPNFPLTNNVAERALRHWVIARRISQGTRSDAGTRAYALAASVIETCRSRSAVAWRYIGEVIAAARLGAELPPLPAIPVGE